jgi:CspA family cold shock protein
MLLKKLINIFRRNTIMKETGTVKWFSPDKGYGFIAPDNGSKDVFIHISALNAAGLDNLDENQKIKYEVTSSQGKESAANIELV